ncbi:MAG: alpha-L-fucosidase [Bacteroidia bacterium]|nr:alpha-L-fucosidase [Bacteroidia bacterium]
MNKCICFLLFLFFTSTLFPQNSYQPTPENLQNRKDFQDRKFGMFIHWGIYSLLGDGEWVMYTQKIPYDKYKHIANAFYPHDFNAKEWVQIAKAAGMKYITITSRHHDGFSMFDSKATGYDIIDATPYKKDPLKELAAACKEEGLKLNFYYSLLDWGRIDYGFGKKIIDGKPEETDWDSYIRFMKTQLTELLSNYGDVISGIWFDGDWERKTADWKYNEIYGLIHQLRPDVMIGNNHHMDIKPGEDYQMFEKDLPGGNSHGWNSGGISNEVPLETCETINNSWGFNINDKSYKTVKGIIHYLVKAAGHNANFLLNVGPQADGKIQQEFADTLKKVGEWLSRNGESIYGTRGNIIPVQEWGCVTAKDKKLFVHILKTPAQNFILLPGIKQKINSVQLFSTKQSIKWKQQEEGVFIYIDPSTMNEVDEIIEVSLK